MKADQGIASSKNTFKLTFEHINYEVKIPINPNARCPPGMCKKKYFKQILKDCSGYVRGGECVFIMGSSGAGKTTLINALSDRLYKSGKKYKFSGSVMINNDVQLTQKNFGKFGAYVMQDDILFSTLTCEEALMFAARLRLNGSKKLCQE